MNLINKIREWEDKQHKKIRDMLKKGEKNKILTKLKLLNYLLGIPLVVAIIWTVIKVYTPSLSPNLHSCVCSGNYFSIVQLVISLSSFVHLALGSLAIWVLYNYAISLLDKEELKIKIQELENKLKEEK